MRYPEPLEAGQQSPRRYAAQLQKLSESMLRKRPRTDVYFLHDNVRSHVTNMSRQKFEGLHWEVQPQPPYSFNLAPSD